MHAVHALGKLGSGWKDEVSIFEKMIHRLCGDGSRMYKGMYQVVHVLEKALFQFIYRSSLLYGVTGKTNRSSISTDDHAMVLLNVQAIRAECIADGIDDLLLEDPRYEWKEMRAELIKICVDYEGFLRAEMDRQLFKEHRIRLQLMWVAAGLPGLVGQCLFADQFKTNDLDEGVFMPQLVFHRSTWYRSVLDYERRRFVSKSYISKDQMLQIIADQRKRHQESTAIEGARALGNKSTNTKIAHGGGKRWVSTTEEAFRHGKANTR